jgi:hypothetical protein
MLKYLFKPRFNPFDLLAMIAISLVTGGWDGVGKWLIVVGLFIVSGIVSAQGERATGWFAINVNDCERVEK